MEKNKTILFNWSDHSCKVRPNATGCLCRDACTHSSHLHQQCLQSCNVAMEYRPTVRQCGCTPMQVKLRMVSASSASAIKQVCKGTLDQPIHYKEEMEYNNMCDRLNC